MASDGLDWLLQEHEGLDELLQQLVRALRSRPLDRRALARSIEGLAADLRAHLESEEAVVLPSLCARLPEAGAAIEALVVEHRQLLQALGALERGAREGAPDLPFAGMRLVQALRAHARAERFLLERALGKEPAAEE